MPNRPIRPMRFPGAGMPPRGGMPGMPGVRGPRQGGPQGGKVKKVVIEFDTGGGPSQPQRRPQR